MANIEHSGASDPKINTIRDKHITYGNAMSRPQKFIESMIGSLKNVPLWVNIEGAAAAAKWCLSSIISFRDESIDE